MRAPALLTVVAACALLGGAVACSPPAPRPEPVLPPSGPSGPSGPGEGATGVSGPTGTSGPTGAGGGTVAGAPVVPPPPLPLPVTSIEARTGTARLALAPDGSPEPVDPAATFEVRLAVAAPGTRLVLLDARDAMVPATSETEVGGGTSRFGLVPHEALVPAARYVLQIEGLESRAVRTDDGRTFEPVAVAFRVAGDPPSPPPRKVKKKRSR